MTEVFENERRSEVRSLQLSQFTHGHWAPPSLFKGFRCFFCVGISKDIDINPNFSATVFSDYSREELPELCR